MLLAYIFHTNICHLFPYKTELKLTTWFWMHLFLSILYFYSFIEIYGNDYYSFLNFYFNSKWFLFNFDFCLKIYISDVNIILLLFHGHFLVIFYPFQLFMLFNAIILITLKKNIVEKHKLSKGVKKIVSFSRSTWKHIFNPTKNYFQGSLVCLTCFVDVYKHYCMFTILSGIFCWPCTFFAASFKSFIAFIVFFLPPLFLFNTFASLGIIYSIILEILDGYLAYLCLM